ncbi:PAS domain-containing protein [Desulfovibrio ferrophilus]|uniref:Putative PAS/PAC sensor protein n=1 Tax=Desulfovibrio ferrophilus TaxID=241368 RepID=A0A2Z6AUV7_9BACT|nr:PAS domain-containing protein [Desulfovibrio ferrophilus]BBD07017.1 putative PAS/PAC sensor protein [Desulfovibrio ferrophilus]
MDMFDLYADRLERTGEYGLLFEPSGRILYANRVWRRRRGVHRGRDLGSVYDGLQESEARVLRRSIAEARGGPPMSDLVVTVSTADGRGMRQMLWRGVELHLPERGGVIIMALGRPLDPVGGDGEGMGFTIRPDGTVLDVSAEICRLCGYGRAEVLAMNTGQLYFDDGEHRRILRGLFEYGFIKRGEVTLRCKDGEPRAFLFTAHALRQRDGSVWAYSGYFRSPKTPDASEMLKTFGAIVEALPDIAWVAGRDHTLAAVNASYLRAFRLRREDAVGGRENKLFQESIAQGLIQAAIRVFEERREIVTSMMPHFAGGALWYRVVRRPIFDQTGRDVVGLLGICTDITRQAGRETAFMESIVEEEGDAVLVIDSQGRLIRRSSTLFSPTVLGAGEGESETPPELTGILDILHPEDLPRAQRSMRRVLAGKGPDSMECRVKNAKGRYMRVAVKSYFNDEFFNEPRMYVVARDIGRAMQLRRAELVLERLKKATGAVSNRELAEFLNVSPASISNAKRAQRIPADWLLAVGRDTGWSMDWLFSGLGAEHRGE